MVAGLGEFKPVHDESDKLLSMTWMRIYRIHNRQEFPDYREAYLPRPVHALRPTTPPCVSVCPPTATTKDEEGRHRQPDLHPAASAAGTCMAACPYHARYFNWFDQYFPPGTERYLNPDVSVRMRGVVEKCHFCHHRWMLAKQKAAYDGEDPAGVTYTPACAEACPSKAISFGNLMDKDSEVAHLVHDKRAFRLLEKLGTEPKVWLPLVRGLGQVVGRRSAGRSGGQRSPRLGTE